MSDIGDVKREIAIGPIWRILPDQEEPEPEKVPEPVPEEVTG
jgi:hypothetical protein